MIIRYSATILLLLMIAPGLKAQEEITASVTGGCDSLTTSFELVNAYDLSQYNSVVWQFGDQETAEGVISVSHTYRQPGNYIVKCVLDNFRIIRLADTIRVSETPVADFVFKDTTVQDQGIEYVFESRYFTPIAGLELQYLWIFPDSSTANYSRPVFSFDEEGVYPVTMTITDQNGCADTIVKMIPVSEKLMVPNVFTPNNDDVNDIFRVSTPGDYIYIFRVYSRNGIQVYHKVSPEISWDGRTNEGIEVNEGTYFYTIQCDQTPAKTSQKGFVRLYR